MKKDMSKAEIEERNKRIYKDNKGLWLDVSMREFGEWVNSIFYTEYQDYLCEHDKNIDDNIPERDLEKFVEFLRTKENRIGLPIYIRKERQ